MPVLDTFRFSQSNLQDFIDCPRRFELRHLLHIAWPALESEPIIERENHRRAGELFHQMTHQYFVGVPKDQIVTSGTDEKVRTWWDRFCSSETIQKIPFPRYPEFVLSGLLGGYRLLAKFDLVSEDSGGNFSIFDWKTQIKLPGKAWLHEKIQTRLYPCLLVMAGKHLNQNEEIMAKKVEMIYWFPEHPQKAVVFKYSAEQFVEDLAFLETLIRRIAGLNLGSFLATDDERKCSFCNYRSYCDRGQRAGNWEDDEFNLEGEPPLPFDIDFDQIEEISF